MARVILFAATDASGGNELWRTDGTEVGTFRILDILPGASGSNPAEFVALANGRAVFRAADGVAGGELWVTDGSAAGTQRLTDIVPGPTSSNVLGLTALGDGRVLFQAFDTVSGTELWVTDGTMSGTTRVADILPGPDGSVPSGFAAIGGGRAVFAASDAAGGTELWITNGTASGTARVADILPGTGGSGVANLAGLGDGRAVFTANDGVTGDELWVTNGTAAGTFRLSDATAGAGGGQPLAVTSLGNGRALFTAEDGVTGRELWVTDGTVAGTARVKDIFPGATGGGIQNITAIGNGRALLSANDGTSGGELWITDGTDAGTLRLSEIRPGFQGSSPGSFAPLGDGRVVFRANDGSTGVELWVTDGTAAGTTRLKDILPGTATSSSTPTNIVATGDGRALFSANDGAGGAELWITDGTSAGTVRLRDINPGTPGSNPGGFTVIATTNTSPGIAAPVPDQQAIEDAPFAFQLPAGTFADGDFGDALTLSATLAGGAPLPAWLTFDAAARSFAGTPGNGDVGALTVRVTATDRAGASVADDFVVAVANTNDVPVLATPLGDQAATRGTGFAYQVPVTAFSDADVGDRLTLSATRTDGTALPSWLRFDAATGRFSGTPGAEDVGTLAVRVTATDLAGASVSDELTIAVRAPNDGPRIVFFGANDGIVGDELWTSDGTAAGTVRVADINPGAGGSAPRSVTALGDGRAVFTASDGIAGNELWVTDGTTAGTRLVLDIAPGAAGSAAANFVGLGNGRVLFQANDGSSGVELWVTEGSAAGTQRLRDINPGAATGSPTNVAALGDGRALFSANDGTSGAELWITDGTAAGTARLRDISAGAGSSTPSSIVSLGNGRAVFQATDTVAGAELWVTDGTEAGTVRVLDIRAGTASSSPAQLAALGNGRALFQANDGSTGVELWSTDGTAAGTFRVRDINPGTATSNSNPQLFVPLGDGRAVFRASDATAGDELWITDGTSGGTQRVRDIIPGTQGSGPTALTPLGDGRVVFRATETATGSELWVTNGTADGTFRLSDILPGTTSSLAAELVPLGDGRILFRANDGVTGAELWVTDGTTAGTRRVADLNQNDQGSNPGGGLLLGNGKVVFAANDGTSGTELWITDGTAAGTSRLLDIIAGSGGSGPAGITAIGGGRAIFQATESAFGTEPWITDGTVAGTFRIADIAPGVNGSTPLFFTPLGNGRVVFQAMSDGVTNREVWVTDGTAAGTTVLREIRSGLSGSDPSQITALGNGRAVFQASDSTTGMELWVTDGTAGDGVTTGTFRVADILAGTGSGNPTGFAAIGNGRAVFQATDATGGAELWVTNGTAAGTFRVLDIRSGSLGSNPLQITSVGNGQAVFQADDGTSGAELWITDGSAAGTRRVVDIVAGATGSNPQNFVSLGNGRAVFQANDGSSGAELWITDGSAGGTQRIADIAPAAGGSSPANFVALGNGRVVFQANDGTTGAEPWVTDGTPGGTFRLADIFPGLSGSNPSGFTVLGDGRAIFQANDGTTGAELYVTDGTAAGTSRIANLNTITLPSNPSGIGVVVQPGSNESPTVVAPVPDVAATEDAPFTFQVPAGTFADADAGDTLTLSARRADGTPLPGWLSFNAATGTFTGTPVQADAGFVDVQITATDPRGAAVSDVFRIAVASVNDAPAVAVPIPDQQIAERAPFTFVLPAGTFADADPGDILTLSARLSDGSQLPAWLAFDPATGRFSGTPGSGDAGSLTVRVTATDAAGASISDDFVVAVTDANDAPVLATPLPDRSVAEDTAVAFTLAAGSFADPDAGDALTLAATLADGTALPGWLTFNATSGAFAGTPPQNLSGTLAIRVTATDRAGAQASDTFNLAILPANDTPVLGAPIPDQQAAERAPFTFVLPAGTFADADPGDVLTLSARLADGSQLPTWLAFDPATGRFSGTPGGGDAASLTVRVTATDAAGASISDDFVVALSDVNDAPVLALPLPDRAVAEDTAVAFTLPAGSFADPDTGDALTLAATLADGTPLPAWLAFDPATRAFAGTPPQDLNGTLAIRVTATDRGGAQASDSFDLAIQPVNDAPVLGAPIGPQTLQERAAWAYQVPVGAFLDPDGDPLTYTANLSDGAPLPSWISFDAATRSFSGTAPAGFSGALTLRVTAADASGAAATQDFALTVANLPDPPVVTGPVTGAAVEDGPAVALNPLANASDADGDTLSVVGLGSLPAGVSLDAATGRLVLDPSVSAYQELRAGATATVTVPYGVSDGSTIVPGSVAWTVTGVNDAPLLTSPVADQAARTGTPFTYALPPGTFADVDAGDALALTVTLADGSPLPAWLAFDAATRTLSGTPGRGDAGTISVRVTATDTAGAVASDNFTLDVTPTNAAPVVVVQIPDRNSPEDQPISFAIPADTFTDADPGDVLTLAARRADGTALPDWLAFDAATGTFSGTPPANFNGALTIRVTATDRSGAAVSEEFALTITPVNDAPVTALALQPQRVAEDAAFAFTIPAGAFADVDGDTLTLSATRPDGSALPGWIGFNAGTRTVSGTPPGDFTGEVVLRVTATDPSGASAFQDVALTVEGANDAPVVSGPVTGIATEDGAPVALSGLANARDPDGNALTLAGLPASLPAGVSYDAAAARFTLDPAAAAFQALAAGETSVVGVDYSVFDGTAATPAQVRWTVTGANDTAAITGTAAGAVAEDGTLTAGGTLTVTDPDRGQAAFSAPASLAGTYGAFTFNAATGAWGYTLANAAANVQALRTGQTVTDTLTLTSLDGTASQVVTVTVAGANEATTNAAPVATADRILVSDATSVVLSWRMLLGNDTDADGQALAITSVSVTGGGGNLVGGTTLNAAAQTITFATRDLGAAAQTTLSYVVSDGAGGTATGTATLQILTNLGTDNEAFTVSDPAYTGAFLNARTGNDILVSGTASDVLIGEDGNDWLNGGAGLDELIGQNGNDTLIGGTGNDALTGGDGVDIFAFGVPGAAGTDRILDFRVGGDDRLAFLQGGGGWNAAGSSPSAGSFADLQSSSYIQTRSGIANIVATDTQRVLELQAAQTGAEITGVQTSAAVNAYVIVFNSTSGRGEVWWDGNWANTADRFQLATLENITTLAQVRGLNSSHMGEWL